MSASSFPFFSVKRSFDMRMHAIRDRGQPALPRYSYPGRYMEKHLLKQHLNLKTRRHLRMRDHVSVSEHRNFKYTVNAKAEGLWKIKTVIKTEAQPKFYEQFSLVINPRLKHLLYLDSTQKSCASQTINYLTFLFFLYSCKRQMTTHLHTRHRQSDVEA